MNYQLNMKNLSPTSWKVCYNQYARTSVIINDKICIKTFEHPFYILGRALQDSIFKDMFLELNGTFTTLKEIPNVLQILNKYIEFNTQDTDAYNMRIKVLMSQGDLDSVLQDCHTVFGLQPSVKNEKRIEIVERLIQGIQLIYILLKIT